MNILRQKLRCTPMGAGLRFGGDSTSETDQTTNQYDKRATGGDGSVNVTGDGASVNYQPIDYGSVTAGIELASNAVNDSATLADHAVTGSLELVGHNTDSALALAGHVVDDNTALSGAAMDKVLAAANAGSSAATASAKASIDAVSGMASEFAKRTSDTFGDALDFAGTASNRALSAQQGAFGDALDTVSEAYETAKAGDQKIVSMVGLAVLAIAAVMALGRGKV